MSPAIWPAVHVAVSPGRHVMLHAAQLPTAGALHDVPVSILGFFVACDFFLGESSADAGPQNTRAAIAAINRDLIILTPLHVAQATATEK
jgi:hypothetical protein